MIRYIDLAWEPEELMDVMYRIFINTQSHRSPQNADHADWVLFSNTWLTFFGSVQLQNTCSVKYVVMFIIYRPQTVDSIDKGGEIP